MLHARSTGQTLGLGLLEHPVPQVPQQSYGEKSPALNFPFAADKNPLAARFPQVSMQDAGVKGERKWETVASGQLLSLPLWPPSPPQLD